jgi:hypothetical protein
MRTEAAPPSAPDLQAPSLEHGPRRTAWRPLLDGAAAASARTVVDEIAKALSADPKRMDVPGLSGAAGRALFFGYLADIWPESPGGYSERAWDYADRVVALSRVVNAGWSLFRGHPGIAWIEEHLLSRFLEPGQSDPNDAIDRKLQRLLEASPWPHAYDLVAGLVGHAVYALERLPRSAAAECLALVVDRLAEQSEARDGGITWLTKPEMLWAPKRIQHPNGYYDLGVAHGVPAVIAVLAAARAVRVRLDKAEALYHGAVAWTLAQRMGEATGSSFPFHVGGAGPAQPARAAWCYGDPGAAAVLYAAARAIGDTALEHEALAIARRASQRPMLECGVQDAGICHGAAGLAHIYNRLWQATGDEIYATAARAWIEETLKWRKPGVGIAGFQAWQILPGKPDQFGWVDDAEILTGAAGIALVLAAAISPVEPAWDRLLLLSLPPL